MTDYYDSPRITSEAFDCAFPITFDQYSFCAFNCLYCFAYSQKCANPALKELPLGQNLKEANFERIKGIFTGETHSSKDKWFYEYFVKQRCPLHWGGLADPFCPIEGKRKLGLKILKFLETLDYPVFFSTKGAKVLQQPEYLELFQRHPENYAFQVSIISLDEDKCKEIEIGVPSPYERLEAMKKLSEIGCLTNLRFRPYIIGLSDKTGLELIERAKEAGATSMSTEFFCYEGRQTEMVKKRYKRMSEVLGYDLARYYKGASVGMGYLRLNRNLKMRYFLPIYRKAKELGLVFGSSDPHFKEFSDSGCCCGIMPQDGKFGNYSRGQWTEALFIARTKGIVHFSDVEKGLEWADNVMGGKIAPIRLRTTLEHSPKKRAAFQPAEEWLTAKTYFRNVWNNPKTAQNPYHLFFPKLKIKGKDEQGNLIYEYVKGKCEPDACPRSNRT